MLHPIAPMFVTRLVNQSSNGASNNDENNGKKSKNGNGRKKNNNGSVRLRNLNGGRMNWSGALYGKASCGDRTTSNIPVFCGAVLTS